jgi:hypothetical protein
VLTLRSIQATEWTGQSSWSQSNQQVLKKTNGQNQLLPFVPGAFQIDPHGYA